MSQIVKVIAQTWNEMTPEQKETYTESARLDKVRYEAQIKELKVKGYFTNQDGTKISSLPLK